MLVRWARATFAGWVLGIPAIIALALLGEAVGIGGSQVLVGAGMGVGLGFMQRRALRGVLERTWPWFWSCVVGLSLPFLVTDVATALYRPLPYSLPLAVVVGGLIAGTWQARLLRARSDRSGAWVAASALGWALAAGTAYTAELLNRSHTLRGIPGALAFLGVVAAGGLVLGLVTGACLAWMLSSVPASEAG